MVYMPVAQFGTLTYTVAPGDVLYTIARNYNSTVDNILKFNNIPDPDTIIEDQKIIIPLSPPEAIIYTVRKGDTVYTIAKKYGTVMKNIIDYNYLTPPYVIYPGQQLVVTASLK